MTDELRSFLELSLPKVKEGRKMAAQIVFRMSGLNIGKFASVVQIPIRRMTTWTDNQDLLKDAIDRIKPLSVPSTEWAHMLVSGHSKVIKLAHTSGIKSGFLAMNEIKGHLLHYYAMRGAWADCFQLVRFSGISQIDELLVSYLSDDLNWAKKVVLRNVIQERYPRPDSRILTLWIHSIGLCERKDSEVDNVENQDSFTEDRLTECARVQSYAIKLAHCHIHVQKELISHYIDCAPECADKLLDEIVPEQVDIYSYTALLMLFATHARTEAFLRGFFSMADKHLWPNKVTITALLTMFAHTYMAKEAKAVHSLQINYQD